MFFCLLMFWLNLVQSQYTFPLLPPPNTVTEVFKIGNSISGNEEYFIQVKNANSDGTENQVIFACLNFFYYQANVAGNSFLPNSYPYCVINYLNVPYFSFQETLIDDDLSEVPDFSYNYLANYILSFALNFMQSYFSPTPFSCYSYVAFNDNLLGNLYQNPNQTYQPYQFIPVIVPQAFYARIEYFLSFENYLPQALISQQIDFSQYLVSCGIEADNFYSTPGTLTNYTEYRCYTDPAYVISVRRNVDSTLSLTSQYLIEQYPAEASVSYTLQYEGDFNYLNEFFTYTIFDYAYVTGWGTTTKFQDIQTGQFVLQEMIKEIRARNEVIQPTINSIYLILGGVNCLNDRILTDLGFIQIAGSQIININTNNNYCFDANCFLFDFSDTCLDEQNIFGNRLIFDDTNLEGDSLVTSLCNLNLTNNCLTNIQNIVPASLTSYAKSIITNDSTNFLGLNISIGSIQVYWYPI